MMMGVREELNPFDRKLLMRPLKPRPLAGRGRCQMPRSPLAARLFEIRSPVARLRENADLISRQRVAKSASPSGNVQTACR
jgi:hypothetical protein